MLAFVRRSAEFSAAQQSLKASCSGAAVTSAAVPMATARAPEANEGGGATGGRVRSGIPTASLRAARKNASSSTVKMIHPKAS